jgi:D-lactate dehydrogenase (quinone)
MVVFTAGSRPRLLLLSRQEWSSSQRRRWIGSGHGATVKPKEEIIAVDGATSTSPRFQTGIRGTASIAAISLTIGLLAGWQLSLSQQQQEQQQLVLPSGLPRTCCEADPKEKTPLTEPQKALFRSFCRIVGKENVLNGQVETTETSPYLKGSRLGKGTALYIVKPQRIFQVVQILREAVDADCVVLVQGQNTGLTGGSVPRPDNHDGDSRPMVIISMKDLNTIVPIDQGERVLCLGGAGLASLQTFVQTHFPDRESHSTLGSTFLNPTTAAGIALGSGGTQCRKGPAFTERALYLKVVPDKFGCKVVKVVNTLGIQELDEEEGEFESHLKHTGVVRALDQYMKSVQGEHDNRMKKSNNGPFGKAAASHVEYRNQICQDDDKVSRYNADTSGRECNRSEGKVLILASVHDTFPKPARSKTFWISFDSLETTLAFRRQVCLDNPQDVPVSMEYMDRDSFDVIDRSGRVLGNMIKVVGTASSLVAAMWKIKLWIEASGLPNAPLLVDKILYAINPILPSILPQPVANMGRQKDHHMAITVGDFNGSLDRFLHRMEAFQQQQNPTEEGRDANSSKMMVYECTSKTQELSLTAFRFVAAPAFRTWCVGQGVQGFSVDYALPRNGGQAPPLQLDCENNNNNGNGAPTPLKRMRYSHFGCNVVHEDLAFPPGVDIHKVKMNLKHAVEHHSKGKLPAEHGHGSEYKAPEPTQQRWKAMDPFNVLNPGIGGLSAKYRYKD